LEQEIALVLSQTQGAFLTSIHGIGIVLAAGICSEIGDPFIQGSAANLASYAGVVPRVKHSGGPESEPGSFICLVIFAEIKLTKKTGPIITCLYGPVSLVNGADWKCLNKLLKKNVPWGSGGMLYKVYITPNLSFNIALNCS